MQAGPNVCLANTTFIILYKAESWEGNVSVQGKLIVLSAY